MLFPLLPQTQMHGQATFFCPMLNKEMTYAVCMDRFVDHTALNRLESPCCRCELGQENREEFARS
jgi:hypothetical protein